MLTATYNDGEHLYQDWIQGILLTVYQEVPLIMPLYAMNRFLFLLQYFYKSRFERAFGNLSVQSN